MNNTSPAPRETLPEVTLVPMHPDGFAQYRQTAACGYAQDNIDSGRWPKAGALQRAYEDFDASLPQGLSTPDHFLYAICLQSTGVAVGILWFAIVVKNGLRSGFVYDVEIQPGLRRHGYARAAFSALEPIAVGLGLSSIGLHVFAHNSGAQALYRSLGYDVTGINMRKPLGGGTPVG